MPQGSTTLARRAGSAPFVALTFPEQGGVVGVPASSPYPSEDFPDVSGLEILIQFSAPMDWSSVEAAIGIKPEVGTQFVAGSDSLRISTRTDAVQGEPLLLETSYQLSIAAGVRDIFGNEMATPFTLEFTTGGLAIPSTFPEDGDLNVPSGIHIIDVLANAPLSAEHDLSQTTVTFNPAVLGTWDTDWDPFSYEILLPLRSLTEYSVVVDGIKDTTGHSLEKPYEFRFTTSDVRLISTRPVDGETEVDPNRGLNLGFTAQMDEAALLAELVLSPTVNLETNGWGSGGQGRSYQLSPEGGYWPAGQEFTVTVPSEITDYFGEPIVNPQSFSFTVANFKCLASWPPNGALGISTSPWDIHATFNNRINADTIDDAVTVNPDFDYNIEYNEYAYDSVAVLLRPLGDLQANTEYTVTISTDLQTDTNVSLESPFVFSFQTARTASP